MENKNTIDEERKRRAFMNALSNLGLMMMIEEEEKTEIIEMSKKKTDFIGF